MKKMLKRLGVVIPSTILTLLMAVGFSTPAFAFVDTTEVTEEPVQVIEEAEPTEEEKIPFTIAGNGEVEDNIVDDPSKEFFTVKTKVLCTSSFHSTGRIGKSSKRQFS